MRTIVAVGRGRRRRQVLAALVLVAVVIATYAFGRSAARSTVRAEVAASVERHVLPLAQAADAIWTTGTLDLPAVSQGQLDLAGGDPGLVLEHADAWVTEFDDLIAQLSELETTVAAAPYHGGFLTSMALSRDAVEVLSAAARADGPVRAALLAETTRVRTRAESAFASTRAGLRQLREAEDPRDPAGVQLPPTLTPLSPA